MARVLASDLDFLAARLHGRRARMAEASRLDALCRLRSVQDLAREAFPGEDLAAAREFQRRAVAGLAREIDEILPQVPGRGRDLVRWLRTRHAVEDWKQGCRAHGDLPDEAGEPPWNACREEAIALDGDPPRPFFLEASLDRAWLRGLLDRVGRLPAPDREAVEPLAWQEADRFHVRLVARGRFLYDLDPAVLRALHVAGTRLPARRFASMAGATTLGAAAARAIGRALDEGPGDPEDPASLEARTWTRFRRLADQAFRRDPIGLGVIAGYLALRRVEVACLVTIAEGIALGVSPEGIRARL